MREYCGYHNDEEPQRCHRPKGHTGDHREFALPNDWPARQSAAAGIPTAVKVGPFLYTVLADRRTLHAIDMDVNGTTGYDMKRITLDEDRPHAAIAETLLHEVLHAIWHTTGRRNEKLTEEEAIRAVSPLLLDVLRSNPTLLAYLLEDADAAA